MKNVNVKNLSKSLSIKISELINVEVDVVAETILNMSGKCKLRLSSNNLAVNMTPKMFEELSITDFGSGDIDGENDLYWVSVHYQYTHLDKGTNGCEIGTIYFNGDGNVVEYIGRF